MFRVSKNDFVKGMVFIAGILSICSSYGQTLRSYAPYKPKKTDLPIESSSDTSVNSVGMMPSRPGQQKIVPVTINRISLSYSTIYLAPCAPNVECPPPPPSRSVKLNITLAGQDAYCTEPSDFNVNVKSGTQQGQIIVITKNMHFSTKRPCPPTKPGATESMILYSYLLDPTKPITIVNPLLIEPEEATFTAASQE